MTPPCFLDNFVRPHPEILDFFYKQSIGGTLFKFVNFSCFSIRKHRRYQFQICQFKCFLGNNACKFRLYWKLAYCFFLKPNLRQRTWPGWVFTSQYHPLSRFCFLRLWFSLYWLLMMSWRIVTIHRLASGIFKLIIL